MFITVSYINLVMLLAVSICHVVLTLVYDDQCPASSFLLITLDITGIIGVILSIITLIIHHCDVDDGSNRWNLLLTYILFVYLLGSRIALSITGFRLTSRTHQQNHCAPILYWASTLLIIACYSIITITSCLLIKLILLQRGNNYYHKSIDNTTLTIQA